MGDIRRPIASVISLQDFSQSQPQPQQSRGAKCINWLKKHKVMIPVALCSFITVFIAVPLIISTVMQQDKNNLGQATGEIPLPWNNVTGFNDTIRYTQ